MENGKSKIKNRRLRGFSLIEVTLAVFLIGMGVLTLFALFPAGLQQSERAIQDTHIGLFADAVFSGVRAEASAIVDWNQWTDDRDFEFLAVESVEINGQELQANRDARIENAVQEDVHIAYRLEVGTAGVNGRLRTANLRAHIGDAFDSGSTDVQWFYTEFFYSGVE